MFKKVEQKEYMAYMGKLIRTGKYNLVNSSKDGYKICCIDKNNKILAYRERDSEGNFTNYILEEYGI